MKKITTIKIATFLGALMFALPAFAFGSTTASFNPDEISVSLGNEFTVTVSIDSHGTKDFAEKIKINYPADLVEVKSFTQAPVWMSLNQPSYDLIDNTNGILIKSAGYPNGFSTPTAYGTIIFKTLKAGNGKITFNGDSKAFQESTQSEITGNSVVINITSGGGGGGGRIIKTEDGGGTKEIKKITGTTTPAKSKPIVPEKVEEIPLMASATGTGFNVPLPWILGIIILLLLARMSYLEYKKYQEKKKNKGLK